MKVLGLIPSRMGSKRLPAKSLLPISGLPLVIHTYRRANLSKLLDKIIICTDSRKIVKTAKKYKSKVLFATKMNSNHNSEQILTHPVGRVGITEAKALNLWYKITFSWSSKFFEIFKFWGGHFGPLNPPLTATLAT